MKVNDRLTPPETLVTVAHELGHIFCGHLGACGRDEDTAGWPDRRGLSEATREMEAEAVAWLVAKPRGRPYRVGRHTFSRYVTEGDVGRRGHGSWWSARQARIESMASLRYSLGF